MNHSIAVQKGLGILRETSTSVASEATSRSLSLFTKFPSIGLSDSIDDRVIRWVDRRLANSGGLKVRMHPTDQVGVRPSHTYNESIPDTAFLMLGFDPNAAGFIEQDLVSLVYELINIESHKDFHALVHDAVRGRITREQYVRDMVCLEHSAILKLRWLYAEKFWSWLTGSGIETDPCNWYLSIPTVASQFIDSYGKDSEYPWKIYGQMYDRHRQQLEEQQ